MLTTKQNIPDVVQNSENFVVFQLNRIHYAIAIDVIQQIIEMVTITPVLRTEAWMEGVINYHGASIPVVNLRRHFGMEVTPYRWHTPIILVNIKKHVMGLIVDEVLNVRAISQEQIVNPDVIIPPGIPETPLLKSIIQLDNKIILLLNLEHLFDQVQVRALATAADVIGKQPQQTLIEKPKKSIARKQGAEAKKGKEAAALEQRGKPLDIDSAKADLAGVEEK